MKHLTFLLLFFVVLMGVSSSAEGVFATSYPSAVAWNNSLYGLSTQEVDFQDIGKEIGKIERQRTPMPKKNGESNEKQVGSLLFSINGADTQDIIAVKVNDQYFKASKLGTIQAEQFEEQIKIAILLVILFLILLTLIIVWRRKRRR